MSTVRVAPGTRRSPNTAGLPPVSSTRPSRPRARSVAASHSPVARTFAGAWLTDSSRRNSMNPSTMSRRRDASRWSNALQSRLMASAGDQDGDRRSVQGALGHAAQQRALDPAMTARPQDEELGARLVGGVQQLAQRVSSTDDHVD